MVFALFAILAVGVVVGTLIGYSLKNYELRNRK